jgi:hypothetical protein
MKLSIKSAATAAIAIAASLPATSHAANFTLHPITVDHTTQVDARAINDSNAITGTYLDPNGVSQAFIQQGNTLTVLPAPSRSCALPNPNAINATGDVSGWTGCGQDVATFKWHAGRYLPRYSIDLGYNEQTQFVGLNDKGEIFFTETYESIESAAL